MEISGVSVPTTPASTSVAVEVQKKTQEIQEQTATTLIEALPDPGSSVGQNIDIRA
jgi:copper chaperone CopZ